MNSVLHRWFLYMLTAGFAVSALCVGTVPARAQDPPSLAELARLEAARRKAVATPSKVVTDKDLKPAPAPAAPAQPGPAAASPEPAAPEAAPAGEPAAGTHDEAWWKTRMESLREELRRSEIFVDSLQSRINALSTEFANRDDPFQRAKIGEDRLKMLAEMERVQRDIERIKKSSADLEEEARRSGVPPGWLR